MNRRDFLAGLFGAAAASAIPTLPALTEPTTDQWLIAIGKVLDQYICDTMVFGIAAIRYDDVWPYVHNVNPQELVPFDCTKDKLT